MNEQNNDEIDNNNDNIDRGRYCHIDEDLTKLRNIVICNVQVHDLVFFEEVSKFKKVK